MAEMMRKEIEDRKLNPRQYEIISAFYSARREVSADERIKYETLKRVCSNLNYEEDLAITIMQKLDDKLIQLTSDKRAKEIEKSKLKKPR